MITKIKQFLTELSEQETVNSDSELSIEMASTVLLCEVMRADGKLDEEELAQLTQLITHRFKLNEEEVSLLIKEAILTSEHAIDFYQFTSKINKNCTIKEKIEMVKHLWLLALADGEVSAIEEHTIRRIADLLHLRQSEYIQAKDVISS
ncbi:TerB family tellurite resistance protein [Thalassotalea piscium]|uniref:Putative tellurite resistance protein B-like protein n=1 Tax=Thalassotalea piscium TaxID=1230533 RepID=A0A7X0NIA3_9GAMM|nr:TerB family tellurite resistance protein [Thalassotalea piscium]MBB6543875.1 putative tellurite resistance protein B-like protein [Thalassotalea piscium]